jgi:MazG family protein
MSEAMDELIAVMARLRAPDGCPWDREQTAASLARYTLEEAYEVLDAIERGDPAHLRDELGDLLFQVVFHARIAEEAGSFDFDAVAAAISAKLRRRHPDLFTPAAGAARIASSGERLVDWENIKAAERRAAVAAQPAAAPVSQLDNVPQALPALMRADKLSTRAARVGFDFDLAAQAADKVAEELDEVRGAARQNPATTPSPQVFDEVGDLLFAAANLARKLGVDAEAALRAANGKFERRFRGMEQLAAARGIEFEALGLVEQEQLWQEMKRGE